MFLQIMSRLARVRFTVGYAATLGAVSIVLVILGPQMQQQVIRNASTNLHNLAHGHLVSLLGSALVSDSGPIYVWLPCLVCLLALAELTWRTVRLTVVFLTGHIGATLLVAAGLTAAVKLGWLPLSISRASDVGMSYGAVAVLGALSAAIPPRWRPVWIGFWIPAAAAAAAVGAEFTDAGHAVALLLGMLVASRFGRPAPWTPVRYALLAVSAVFGFLMLAHTEWSTLAGAGVGVLGALGTDAVVRYQRARRPLSVVTPQPTLNG
ncbi:hypothetical protein MSP7336_03594 [Mycobacterium shimoidei]|uniref:Transmembrane protein n=1 Tax=Mycobacterium shimoidei TaxID=29313 RepID=A0A375Z2K3_MYCSH|nr:rhomboid-like protein [Mycobacterium shimoidei]SRX95326.1 hypothetical protein MSP7336_03594 [Mycobacterium shimoidei]